MRYLPRPATGSVRRQRPVRTRLGIEQLEARHMLTAIQVTAAGTTNDEQIELQIDGQTVQTWSNLGTGAPSGQFVTLSHTTAQSVTADQVRVVFTNDLYDPGAGIDRNVRVDAVLLDATRYETEDLRVFSTGTWLPADGVTPGFGRGEYLHTNGYFQYASESDGSLIEIRARSTAGTAEFELQIDGQTADSFSIGTSFTTVSFDAQSGVNPEQVRVAFTNDLWDPENGVDRNLVVDYIAIDGQIYETEDDSVFSTGTWTAADGIVHGFARGEILHTNGYFQFAIPTNNGAVVEVRARGTEGTEEFELQIDGQTVRSFQVSTNFSTYAYQAPGLVAPDQVRIVFTNDQWDEAAGIDANLIVDSISIDATIFQTEHPSVFSTGTWVSGQGVVPGYWQTETLNVNGYFQYDTVGPINSPVEVETTGYGTKSVEVTPDGQLEDVTRGARFAWAGTPQGTSWESANTAYWATIQFHDWLEEVHGMDSWDDAGGQLVVNQDAEDGCDGFVFFGSNEININSSTPEQVVPPELVAHEWVHVIQGIESVTYDPYQDNYEHMADVISFAFDAWLEDGIWFDWKFSEDCSGGTGWRNAADPNALEHPDTRFGDFWDSTSGHNRGDVGNHAFYLMVEGGSGVNDVGLPYTVTPIADDFATSITQAGQIAMRTIRFYDINGWENERASMIQAAEDLFGVGSRQALAVADAYAAVNVVPTAGESGAAGGSGASGASAGAIEVVGYRSLPVDVVPLTSRALEAAVSVARNESLEGRSAVEIAEIRSTELYLLLSASACDDVFAGYSDTSLRDETETSTLTDETSCDNLVEFGDLALISGYGWWLGAG